MTITSNNPTPTIPSPIAPGTLADGQGFPTIPTRIRDVRDAQVPPLVVDPVAEQDQAAMRQGLAELGIKLADVHRTAAEAYMSQGLYEESLPHLQAAATFSPSEVEYQMQLGFVQYVTGDDAGAITTFNKVLTADGTNGEAWFNMGMVLFGQGQFAESETCFAQACELDGRDAQTWNNRGVCLWKLQRTEEAQTCFQNAIRIDPSDEDAKFNLQSLGQSS